MRRAALVIALALTACDGAETDKPSTKEVDKAPAKAEPEPEPDADDEKLEPDRKVHGNLPIKTESELAGADAARSQCLRDCVEARKIEGKGADAIEAECHESCAKTNPIEQVEVVPDQPPPQ